MPIEIDMLPYYNDLVEKISSVAGAGEPQTLQISPEAWYNGVGFWKIYSIRYGEAALCQILK
jgi:hypothetical protein